MSTTDAPPLTASYISRVKSDFESNVKEQKLLRAEIAERQEKLSSLAGDHDMLVALMKTLGIAAPADTDAVPENAGNSTPSATKTSAQPGKPDAKRTRKRASGRDRTSRTPQTGTATASTKVSKPTQVELVRSYLQGQSGPHSAGEVTAALNEAHPERGFQVKVIRQALDALVAKNDADRQTQGKSVYYVAKSPGAPALGAPSEDTGEDNAPVPVQAENQQP
ncbi:hypothetical protein [Streptomyces acidiscabies]|uniref:Regulatory protein n=1 Tax=Streptomyces acidiscabies TaxID=42234 RepID=A0ABU4MG30_9ACTN|nr:hypothetical protein [Streptomyces acidiscabies]MDX3025643.1 hypothetical protein [Streptomyces acidiscabies]